MLIAKLRISLENANIHYNSCKELSTDKHRGTVLEDGKVVRGLGTHFADKASQERYDRLTKASNIIREKFNKHFMRTPIDGTFIINNKGEGKAFIGELTIDPELAVSVIEFELGSTESLDETEMREWGQRVKNQLTRIPLGRGEQTDEEGLTALQTLASCPVLSKETAQNIRTMIEQVRVGQMTRVDFKRNIEMLNVEMDQATLTPKRPSIV
jgi:hypothetical protein